MLTPNQYPIILISKKITDPYVEGEPQPPNQPKAKDLFDEAISGAWSVAIKSGWFSIPALLVGAAVVGIPGLAIATTVTGVAAVVGGLSGAENAKNYNENVLPIEGRRYSQLVAEYRSELEEFRQKLPSLQMASRSQAISNTKSFDSDNSNAPVGFSEQKFENYLRRCFGNKIRTRVQVTLYQDFPYTPDFTYYDSTTNLHIDIEIDEPYTLNQKKSIHYLEDNREAKRNDHFLSRGWLVIRFAEEQIVREPHKCCDLISEIIQALTNREEISQSGKSYSGKLFTVPRWSYDKAQEMANTDYRLVYLRPQYKDRICSA